jgi:hypothetical protein
MSRLEVPVRDRTLYATGDILLRVELDLDIKTTSGAWKSETFLVDSGTEMTTFPAWVARQVGFPMPQNPTRHAIHAQTGLEIRSGVLRFKIVGMDQTEYHVPCLFLGDPNSRPSVNAPAGVMPRKLLQPLQLLDVLRFEMKKEPAAGFAYGMLVVEKV